MTEEEVASLAVFAKKLALYRCYITGAAAFFVFGATFTSIILLSVSIALAFNIDVFQNPLIGIITVVSASFTSVVLFYLAAPMCRAEEVGGKPVPKIGLRYALSFLTPFTVLYSIPISRGYEHIVWYPALGIALLLAYLSIEKEERIGTKLFLLVSTIILITTPIVILFDIYKKIGAPLATSLMLLAYTITGVYALYRGKKLFE